MAIKNSRTGQWVVKNAKSTFFPDRWTERQVIDNINAAYIKAVSNGKVSSDGKFTARVGGVLIEGFIDEAGKVKTAYLLYGK